MKQFIYKALTEDGKMISGQLNANDYDDVIMQLQGSGYYPIEAKIKDGMNGYLTALQLPSFSIRKKATVQHQDILLFTKSLATVSRSGVAIDDALDLTATLLDNPEAQALVNDIKDKIKSGSTLSNALNEYPKLFPAYYVSSIKAGELSGNLTPILDRLVTYYEDKDALVTAIKSALIYPMILFTFAIISVYALMVFVVPKFRDLLTDISTDVPFLTSAVFALSDFFSLYWWLFLSIPIILLAIFLKAYRTDATRKRIDQTLLRLPLLGSLYTKLETARFTLTLNSLLTAGVPLINAVPYAVDIIQNKHIKEQLSTLVPQLEHGKGLARPLSELNVFPKICTRLITLGEESGNINEMLGHIAAIYNKEIKQSISKGMAILEPVLILGIGFFIGTIVVSILLSLMSINDFVI